MKIIDLQTGKEYTLRPEDRISAAIGNFDGVHIGHRALLALAAEKRNGITKSAVFTFSEPTSRKLGGVSLLTAPEERYDYFRALGIDLLLLADFDAIRSLDADRFAKEILYDLCRVRHAVCGFNFRYGKKAAGNAETLKDSFSALGCAVTVLPPYQLQEMTVSSSAIREALAKGDIPLANAMLGRPYALTAEVIHGKKLGRTLGFPTANQSFPTDRAVPKFGVYAVRVLAEGQWHEGVANVGVRPTVEQTDVCNCETYLFDYKGDLYGKLAKTEFCAFLRAETVFPNVESLTYAVKKDIAEAKRYFKESKETPQ